MKPTITFIVLFIIVIFITSACSSSVPTSTASHTLAIPPTNTTVSTETFTPEPSFTPTLTILALEILEWSEWPYANPADPSNTDTHVEVLIRNPNDFPVRVNRDVEELRFINSAGEVVYTNPSPFLYIWQGEWMLPGETAALSACVCFMTQGIEKQDWESLELFAPLEIANDIAYTLDVEFTLGEIINLAEAHLGGNSLGLEIFLANTSDQVLESMPMRVLARDANGRFVGVATFGNAVVSWTKNIGIQPGDTATGIAPSDINYIDINVPLTYEAVAIGIPYQVEPTQEVILPSGTPLAEWEGFPIMPGAIGGEVVDDTYQYTISANLSDIVAFYETELSNLGFEVEKNVDETAGQTFLYFQKESLTGMVAIISLGGLNGVAIIINSR